MATIVAASNGVTQMSFLAANAIALRELDIRVFCDVDAVVLDFAVWRKDVASRSLRLQVGGYSFQGWRRSDVGLE